MKKLLIASCIGLTTLPLFATSSSQEISIDKQALTHKTCIPALDVKIVPLIRKELSLPFKGNDVPYTYHVESAKTNVPWLNQLLLNSLISSLDQPQEDILNQQDLVNYYQKMQQNELKELKESLSDDGMMATGEVYSSLLSFLGQRLNIASFQRNTYIYHNGAAHGIGFVKILNFNLNKHTLLTVQDILLPGKQQALLNLLWQNYQVDVMENDPFIEKNQFYIPPNFLFDMDGMTFIYQPYEIGPYSMGNIELKLSWHQLKDIIKPEYQW